MTQVLERPPEFTEQDQDVRGGARQQRVTPIYVNRSLVLLRVVVGLLFMGHASQKLMGWFGGPGMTGWMDSIQKAGMQPVAFWAYLEAFGELGAGALLVLGLLTPLAAAFLIGDMVVAIFKVHASKGLWSQNGGFEYNLVLVALLLVVGLVGPGLYSFDRRLPFHHAEAAHVHRGTGSDRDRGGRSIAHVAAITRDAIAQTYELIKPYVRRTPTIDVDGADFSEELESALLTFKLEHLQRAGVFKTRGAFAHLLTREVPAAGVVAASGGNHGAAVAYAAMKRNVKAHIFVPTVSSPAKIERIRRYGAELVVTGDLYADALEASEQWAAESGALRIHAYDQPETLLGQGSVGLELAEQAPGLDTLLVAVGGGGLIGGIAAWYDRRIRVVGVEPEAAPTLTRALAAGRPVDSEAGSVAADSLAPRRVGELMFPIAQRAVDSVVLVSDAAILQAQAALWETLRLVVEPGGAATTAALLSGAYQPGKNERVGVLLSGGNTVGVSVGQAVARAPVSARI